MGRAFLQHRFYPTLRPGPALAAAHGTRHLPLYCRQGDWDGACGVHCAAMALALFGLIRDVANLSKRRRGVAGRLWEAAKATYFDGADGEELAAIVDSLNTRVRVKHHAGRHRETLAFAQRQLAAGELVILSCRSRDYEMHHWVLAIGAEGLQQGSSFDPTALLVVDPGSAEPVMAGYNARLELRTCSHRGYLDYVTNDGLALPVRLTGAVSMKEMP